jgi:two-component system response regulator YesN
MANTRRSLKQDRLLAYIQQHCHPSLTVGELADRMRVSRSALSKSFHRDMGLSLKSYILQMLMQKSKELMLDENLTVQEVARLMGYEDPYYFHRIFKKHTGQTPLEYRRSARMRPLPAW